MITLLTIGHGADAPQGFLSRCRAGGVDRIIDVRTAPGSRRHPHFSRGVMEEWLAEAGIGYAWEQRLGGFRRPRPDSLNWGLRNASFRGYADYMAEPEFAAGFARVLADAAGPGLAVMCSETLWWRCHRRLIADHAVLVAGLEVLHVDGRGNRERHRVTSGASAGGATVTYPQTGDTQPPLPLNQE